MIGNPFTNDGWAAETADRVENVVGVVRDRVTNNIVKVVRGIVFGLIGLILGIALIVIALIMMTRAVQSGISLITGNSGVGHSRSVYVSYLACGLLMLAVGGLLMRRRRSSET
jgi:uncharacterized membrane protein